MHNTKLFQKTAVFWGLFFLLAANSLFAADNAATRRFGIFIGANNGGRDRVTLRYAVNDARLVSRIFTGMGGISAGDSKLLVEPSVAEINRQLDNMGRLSALARRNSQRTELVFYYSGHSDEDGIFLNRERYGYRELRDRINAVQADMRIVILDSCSSGAITRAKGGVKTQPFLFDSSVSASGYAFLTSSSDDEASQESDNIGSSYFTHSLLAGLRGAADSVGDGRVTLNELYRYAYTETLAKTETSVYGPQHPSYDIQISGSGDVVLTDIKEISASLLIAEELTGRISIRDSSFFLVAELTKVTLKPIELGLEPGQYSITLQRGDAFYRVEVKLPENKQTVLGMENFSMIAAASGDRNRGDFYDAKKPEGNNLYTFFFNRVYEGFRFPLIGFINIALGNFNTAELGFVNWNTENFNGFQGGFVNTVGGELSGVQSGFVNTSFGSVTGWQGGFVNTTWRIEGAQTGFVNTAFSGGQGLQAGFVNTAVKGWRGAQMGFVNISARKIKGAQLGFVNYAESFEEGIPIGFISIVREGHYRAVEYSFSEFFPFSLAFKIGVERFYTTFIASFNPFQDYHERGFGLGMGIGSIIPVFKSFFVNPELQFLPFAPWNGEVWWEHGKAYWKDVGNLTTLALYFGYNINKYFSLTFGPTVTWEYSSEANLTSGLFHIFQQDINDKHRITVGIKAAIRFRF